MHYCQHYYPTPPTGVLLLPAAGYRSAVLHRSRFEDDNRPAADPLLCELFGKGPLFPGCARASPRCRRMGEGGFGTAPGLQHSRPKS